MIPEDTLVLIVDDSDRNRRLAGDLLRFAGFRTIEAATAADGIALAAEQMPDVILMDLRLPDLDGAKAVGVLQAEPRTSRIPVVAMTATPLGDETEWLRAAGFAGHIAKPFDTDTFAERVTRFADRRE